MKQPTYLSCIPDAEQHIRNTGERLTQPRLVVLALMLASDHAISHQDVASAIAAHHPIDRVTVYRVLEWLVEVGIAHRIAGDDRVWRFMLNHDRGKARNGPSHQHAHFTCNQCGQTFCLNDVSSRLNVTLPDGFKPSEMDLKFRGACAHCS